MFNPIYPVNMSNPIYPGLILQLSYIVQCSTVQVYIVYMSKHYFPSTFLVYVYVFVPDNVGIICMAKARNVVVME